jgi:hypothetical protein
MSLHTVPPHRRCSHLWWREAPGGVNSRTDEIAPHPSHRSRPLTMCPPSPQVGGMRRRGRHARSERDEHPFFTLRHGLFRCARNDGANLIVPAPSLPTIQPHRRSSSLPRLRWGRDERSSLLAWREAPGGVNSRTDEIAPHPSHRSRRSRCATLPTKVGGTRKSGANATKQCRFLIWWAPWIASLALAMTAQI